MIIDGQRPLSHIDFFFVNSRPEVMVIEAIKQPSLAQPFRALDLAGMMMYARGREVYHIARVPHCSLVVVLRAHGIRKLLTPTAAPK